MTILLLSWYYSPNLGDAVLTDCTAALLRTHYPEATICVRDLIGRQQFPAPATNAQMTFIRKLRQSIHHCIARLDRRRLHALHRHRPALETLIETACDAVVFAGGQLFMDSLSVYVRELTRGFARRGVPVFFNACGLGLSRSAAVRRTLGQALQLPNVRYLSCRDDVVRLNHWCGTTQAVFAADPALYAATCYGIHPAGTGILGLGILYTEQLPARKMLIFWQQTIRFLERNGIRWQLFTNGAPADRDFAQRLLDTLPELTGPQTQYLHPSPTTPRALVEQIAGYDSLLSFRLHSHIIAASLGIASIGIAWDDKVPAFFRQAGCPERCFPVSASPETLWNALKTARRSRWDTVRLSQQRTASSSQLLQHLDAALLPNEN